MSYGLRVWDAAGSLVLDVTDRLTRYHGAYSCTLGGYGTHQDVTVPGIADDGTWAAFTDASALSEIFSGYVRVTDTVNSSGGTATIYVFRL